ncbi:hypothetical protein [Spiroplasma endosymbiont of Labia minor]|uniref:hypothetical protein n=1 Tax=Spiroplasma endosymbiont of Labia minor TaxID=3066305 RepID=UPI0030D334E3
MRKILLILGSLSLATTTVSTTACTFNDGIKSSISNTIKAYINQAGVAARAGILNDASQDKVDSNYAFQHYKSMAANDVLSDIAQTDNTMDKIFRQNFDTDGNNADFTHNNVETNLTNWSGTVPIDNSLVGTLQQVQMLITLLAQGFNPSLASQLESILGSSSFSGTINSLVKTISGFLTPELLNGLADAFDDSAYKNRTYLDSGKYLVIDLSNSLASFWPTEDKGDYQNIGLPPAGTEVNDDDATKAQDNIAIEIFTLINGLFNGGDFDITSLLPVISPLIKILGLISNYASQFDLDHVPFDSNHLFSNTDDNITVINNINASKYNNSNGTTIINLQKLIKMLDIFLVPKEGDYIGFGTQKMIGILFGSDSKEWSTMIDLLTFPSKSSMSYIVPPLLDGIAGLLVSGNISIIGKSIRLSRIVAAALTEILKKVSQGEDVAGVVAALRQALNLVSGDTAEMIKALCESLEVYNNKGISLWNSLYSGNVLEEILNKLISGDSPIKALLKNLKSVLNLKLDNIFDVLNLNVPILNGLRYESISSLIAWLATLFEVNGKNFADLANFTIELDKIRLIFKKISQTVTESGIDVPDLLDDNGITIDKNTTSLFTYGLMMLLRPKVPHAGIAGTFKLFGYDSDVSTTNFTSDSMFEAFQQSYTGDGMSKVWITIGDVINKLIDGSGRYEKDNFLVYFDDGNFKIYDESFNVADNIMYIDFKIKYTDPKNKQVSNYNIVLQSTGYGGKLQFKKFNRI